MSHQSRAIFLFLTIVAVVLVSAVGTTSVYADDGTPPPPPTETSEVDPSTGGDVVTEPPAEVIPPAGEEQPVATEPAVAEPAATEPAVVEPVATEPAVVESIATEPAVTEEAAPAEAAPVVEEQQPAEPEAEAASLLEQVPDDTTVTVLNAEGEAQPLTTQESAEIIVTGDPIWCPQWQSPTPGQNGCTDSYEDLDGLLDFLQANEGDPAYQQAGTIYVQAGAYTGSEPSIDFNSHNFQNINNYDLTLQGGWDTTGTNIDPANPTQFNVPILIGTSTNPWAGSLTFNNISITGVSSQTGLVVYSQADITLGGVEITSSQGGANLNAGGNVVVQDSKFNNNKKFGAQVDAGGVVYITNSEFNNNAYSKDKEDGFGLQVKGQDEVYLSGVSANSNEKFGADITATGPAVVVNSFFNGNVSYTHNCYKSCTSCKETANGGYGLKIVTSSSAYLEGVTAEKNFLFGTHVEALDAEVYNSSFSANGSGSESNPKGYGLEVLATGGNGVTLEGVHADNNQLFGANIQAGSGQVTVRSSFFDGNKSYIPCNYYGRSCTECKKTYEGYGLQVVTTNDITLRGVSATGNNLFGAHLDGANIAVRDSTFSNNGTGDQNLTGEGLDIISSGQVALRDVQANGNQLFGANVQAVGNVSIADSAFSGQKFTYTSYKGSVTVGGYGLHVVTTGNVSLAGVEASNNYLYGALLQGADVSVGVSITDSSGSFFENSQSGLEIKSTGEVALNKVTANNNSLFGATVQATGSVAIRDSFFNGNKSYSGCPSSYQKTCSECKSTPQGYGLRVVTSADIALYNVQANGNNLYGAYLEGTDVRVTADPTVGSSFSNNGTGKLADHIGKGLEIKSTGSDSVVTLSEVVASNNQLFGADIKADGLVFIDNSVFNGNKSYTGCPSSYQKTCSECKTTYNGYGLKVVTTSDIALENVTANENYLFGASLQGADVTVKNSTFSLNSSPDSKNPSGEGLEIKSTGDTSLNGVEANDNQLFGADIQADGKVTVSDSAFLRNVYYTYSSCKGTKSNGYGLKVVSKATNPDEAGITLTNVNASANGAEGGILDGQSAVNVTDSTFSNNGANGLTINAKGNVTLTDIAATGNKGNGVEVTGVCTNTVIVNDGTFTDNAKYGIKVVNATYEPHGTQTFLNNGSGNVFQDSTTCVKSSSTSTGSSSTTSGSTSGSHWWYWWWYWSHFGHR